MSVELSGEALADAALTAWSYASDAGGVFASSLAGLDVNAVLVAVLFALLICNYLAWKANKGVIMQWHRLRLKLE